ncbi:calcium channel flower isoform X2 [Frankliniella occidentalis]|nr:calcium channel flower isoform X2 [Frankliniella occidentalis]XP_026273462.1 calcium channel flower isoform X2 [Frankliniella occidentalis]
MQRPGQDAIPNDDVPWWMKYAGRGLGTVGGGIAIFLGIWAATGILFAQIDCLIAGIWQMLAGFLVIVIEAPCCCMFLDFVQSASDFMEQKPYYYRGALYIVISLPAVVLCLSLSTIFGSGLIFGTGVIYGMMSLGKKASAEEMRTKAAAGVDAGPGGVAPDVQSHMKSSLVDNAQPVAFTGSPYDSNV